MIHAKKNHYLVAALFTLLLLPVSLVYSQTFPGDETTVYVIDRLEVRVDGRTRAYFIQKELEIEFGEILIGKAAFDAYIADKKQLLINQRPLDEESVLDYRLFPEGVNRYSVLFEIRVKDSWNLIALPYFKYDSNEGLLLSIRARDYNFFGTLQTLAVNLNYELETELESDTTSSVFGMEIDFSLPFRTISRDWIWDQKFGLKLSQDDPFSFRSNSNLSILFPLNLLAPPDDTRDWRLRFSQDYYLNRAGSDDEDGWYLSSGVSFGSSFRTPFLLGSLGRMSYAPSVFTETNYKPGSGISEDRRGLRTGFTQSLSAGRIDWNGNFRSGERVTISNTNAYNWTRETWPVTLTGEVEFHRPLGFAGFSSRIYGFSMLNSTRSDAGGPIRGILDKRIDASTAGAYLNLDFPVKMWIWFMSRWFEGHLGPFVDVAIMNPAPTDAEPSRSFDPSRDIWYGAGVEAFAFAKFSRALYLRISVGVDLEAFFDDYRITGKSPFKDQGDRLEVFIGLGHHY